MKQVFIGHAWPPSFKGKWNKFGFLEFDSTLHRYDPYWKNKFPKDYRRFKITIEEIGLSSSKGK